MSKLLQNIGRCVLACQQIEVILGTMLFLERHKKLVDMGSAIEEMAKLRTNVLESLKNELKQEKVSYIDFTHLDQVISKRNWFTHRLSFEARFVHAEKSGDDYSDIVKFFSEATLLYSSALFKRAKELGIGNKDFGPDHNDEYLAHFTDSVARRSDEILAARKTKK